MLNARLRIIEPEQHRTRSPRRDEDHWGKPGRANALHRGVGFTQGEAVVVDLLRTARTVRSTTDAIDLELMLPHAH